MGGHQSKNRPKSESTDVSDVKQCYSVGYQDAESDGEGTSVDRTPADGDYGKKAPSSVLSGLPGEAEDIEEKEVLSCAFVVPNVNNTSLTDTQYDGTNTEIDQNHAVEMNQEQIQAQYIVTNQTKTETHGNTSMQNETSVHTNHIETPFYITTSNAGDNDDINSETATPVYGVVYDKSLFPKYTETETLDYGKETDKSKTEVSNSQETLKPSCQSKPDQNKPEKQVKQTDPYEQSKQTPVTEIFQNHESHISNESNSTCYLEKGKCEKERESLTSSIETDHIEASQALVDQAETITQEDDSYVTTSHLSITGNSYVTTSHLSITGNKSALDPLGQFRKRRTWATNDNRIKTATEDVVDDAGEQQSIYTNIIFLPDKCKGAFPKRHGPKRLGSRNPEIVTSLEGGNDDRDDTQDDCKDSEIAMTMIDVKNDKKLCRENHSADEKNVTDESFEVPQGAEAEYFTTEEPIIFVEDHFGLYTGCIASGISKEFNAADSSDIYHFNQNFNPFDAPSFNSIDKYAKGDINNKSNTQISSGDAYMQNKDTNDKSEASCTLSDKANDGKGSCCNGKSGTGISDCEIDGKREQVFHCQGSTSKSESNLTTKADSNNSETGDTNCLSVDEEFVAGSAVLRFSKSIGIEIDWSRLQSTQGKYAIGLRSHKTSIADDNRMILEFGLHHCQGSLESEEDTCEVVKAGFGSYGRSVSTSSESNGSFIVNNFDDFTEENNDFDNSYKEKDIDHSNERKKFRCQPSTSYKEDGKPKMNINIGIESNTSNGKNSSKMSKDPQHAVDSDKAENGQVTNHTDHEELLTNVSRSTENELDKQNKRYKDSINTELRDYYRGKGGHFQRKKTKTEVDNSLTLLCSEDDIESFRERDLLCNLQIIKHNNKGVFDREMVDMMDDSDIETSDYNSLQTTESEATDSDTSNIIDLEEDIVNHEQETPDYSGVRDNSERKTKQDVVECDEITEIKHNILENSETIEIVIKETVTDVKEESNEECKVKDNMVRETQCGSKHMEGNGDHIEGTDYDTEHSCAEDGVNKNKEEEEDEDKKAENQLGSKRKYKELRTVLRSKKTKIEVDNRITLYESESDNEVSNNDNKDKEDYKDKNKSENHNGESQVKDVNFACMSEFSAGNFKKQSGIEEAKETDSDLSSEPSSPISPTFSSLFDQFGLGLGLGSGLSSSDPFLRHLYESSQRMFRDPERSQQEREKRRRPQQPRRPQNAISAFANSFYEREVVVKTKSSKKVKNQEPKRKPNQMDLSTAHSKEEKTSAASGENQNQSDLLNQLNQSQSQTVVPSDDGQIRGNGCDEATPNMDSTIHPGTEDATSYDGASDDNESIPDDNSFLDSDTEEPTAEEPNEDGAIFLEGNVWSDIIDSEVEKCYKESPLQGTTRCTVLCLDISASMEGEPWQQMMLAVTDFIQGLKDVKKEKGIEEYVALVTFGHETKIAVPLTFNYDLQLVPNGVSPMYAGIHLALFPVFKIAHSRFAVSVFGVNMIGRVLMFSDGHATHSTMIGDIDCVPERNKDKVVDEIMQLVNLLKSGFTMNIFCMPVGEDVNTTLLEKISTTSGGRVVSPGDIRELAFSTYNHYIAVQIGKPMLQMTKLEKIDPHLFTSLVLALYPECKPHDTAEMLVVIERVHKLNQKSKEKKNWSGSNSPEQSPESDSSNNNSDDESDTHFEREELPPIGTRVSRGPDPFAQKYMEDLAAAKGTVTGHSRKNPGRLFIHWDSGIKLNCRYGDDNKFHAVADDAAQPCVVTDPVKIGYKVRRGADWQFGDQDGGSDQLGSVYSVEDKGVVKVRWPNGYCGNYRYNYDNVYDVIISDPEDPFGAKCYTEEMNRKNISKTLDNFGRNEYRNQRLNIDLSSSLFETNASCMSETLHSGLESDQDVAIRNKNAIVFADHKIYTDPSQTGAIPKRFNVSLSTS